MRPDDLSPHNDLDDGVNPRRPVPARSRAWLCSASLGLLFVATSWAVGVYASPWLIFPYWIMMAALLGLPSSGKPSQALSSEPIREPLEIVATVEDFPQGFDDPSEPSASHEDPDFREAAADMASDPSTLKTKKTRGRPRKVKAVVVVAEPAPATWVQVRPGKFVRSDMLHPDLSEPSQPIAPAILPDRSDDLDREDSNVPDSDLEPRGVNRLGEALEVAPDPSSQEAFDSDTIPGVRSTVEPIQDVFMAKMKPSGERDNGNAPDAPSLGVAGFADVAIRSTGTIEMVANSVEIDPRLEPADEPFERFDLETLQRPEIEVSDDSVAISEVEDPWNLEARESDFQANEEREAEALGREVESLGDLGGDLAVRRSALSPYGAGGSRANGRRRGLVGAGLFGDRSNRKGVGTGRASRRAARWSSMGRPSRASRSHPPRSPPCRLSLVGAGGFDTSNPC